MDTRALGAEFAGTFAILTAVCGATLFSAPSGGGLIAVAFAVGLSVLAMTCAVGHVSGAHFNPAVTLGLVAAGRFGPERALPYIVAQLLGGFAAVLIFWLILAGAPAAQGATHWNDFLAASNTYGTPQGFTIVSVFLIEAVITALLLIVFVGATSSKAPAGFAPIAIGLAYTLFHLVAIPVSNASLNPARSTATALLAGGDALGSLWLFWVAPILGGVLGGAGARWLDDGESPARPS